MKLKSCIALLLASSAIFLSGCFSPKIATCSEFAEMKSDTGLFSTLNEAQINAIDDALLANDFSADLQNESLAFTKILSYCNIVEGYANSNRNSLITEAVTNK